MKKSILFIVLICFCSCVLAQQKLLIKGKSNARYVEHRVGDKESLSSLGRMYGLTASQIARFNGRSPSSVLSKGSLLKIPVNVADIDQKSSGTPVYHTVIKGDNLFKISQQYNKVPVTQLRKWNKLGNGGVKNGEQLIIGYLKTNIEQTLVQQTPKEITTEKELTTLTEPAKTTVVTEQPKTTVNKETEVGFHKDYEEKNLSTATTLNTPDEGAFASLYVRNDLTLVQQYRSGDAATFKSTSGWTDRKYYVLINDITPGTIVRITAANNKSICARVLSPLPAIKGDEGLLLRMNNAAASALGIKEDKFTITLTYFE